jgi:two-component system sensor histidine kinase BaeS
MRRSFVFRLALTFAGVGIAAAAITSLLVNVAFGNRFNDYLAQERKGRQAELVRALEDSYARTAGWDAADLKSLSALALSDGGELRLMDMRGSIVWEPTATPEGSAMAALHRQMMGGGPLGAEQSIPILVAGTQVGTAALRLPEPGLNPQDVSFRAAVNRLLLLGGLIAGLLALVLGVMLARRTLGPAREMTLAAQALAAGDRSHRVTVDATVELGAMGEAFNQMADTIEDEDRLRRLFATDVAHELRTPLAILRTQIEALQDGVSEPTPEVMASLHEETLRLTRLVEDLETLASAEAAHFSLKLERIELTSILEAVAAEFAGPYDSRGVALVSDLDAVSAHADRTRVGQIVSNLLSNALKFTPPGGEVGLFLRAESPWAVVEVSDSGVGISPDEGSHVFERFYRGKDTRVSGSGIGLTVVRELVLAHGGSVDLSSNPRGGATFTVRLPEASPQETPSFTEPSHQNATLGAKGDAP